MSGSSTYTANDFYNEEVNRLNLKQQNANAIMNSQNRLAMLNDSYRKRYSKYVEILMVLILAYVIYLGVIVLQKNIPTIPQIVVDVVVVVLLFLVFVYLFSAITELYSRSSMNYDELDVPAFEDSKDSTGDQNKAYDAGDVVKLKNDTCIGNDCCPSGYVYDSVTNRCIPDTGNSGQTSGANTGTSGQTSGGSTGTNFTTLEYEQVENAYTDKSFNSADLKRAPNAQNVAPLKEVTSLNYSTF